MRKTLLTVILTLSAIFAQAGEYGYLLFTNAQGTNTFFTVNNLTMTVSGSELQVTNDDGTTLFILTDLVSMQFSKEGQAEGIENVLDADAPVEVFTPLGVRIGRFDNLLQAAGALDKGAYVITNGKNAQTIILQ